MGLPLHVVSCPVRSFVNRCQLQVASWLGMEDPVHFPVLVLRPPSTWTCADLVNVATISDFMCQLLWPGRQCFLGVSPLTLRIFSLPLPHRSEPRGEEFGKDIPFRTQCFKASALCPLWGALLVHTHCTGLLWWWLSETLVCRSSRMLSHFIAVLLQHNNKTVEQFSPRSMGFWGSWPPQQCQAWAPFHGVGLHLIRVVSWLFSQYTTSGFSADWWLAFPCGNGQRNTNE